MKLNKRGEETVDPKSRLASTILIAIVFILIVLGITHFFKNVIFPAVDNLPDLNTTQPYVKGEIGLLRYGLEKSNTDYYDGTNWIPIKEAYAFRDKYFSPYDINLSFERYFISLFSRGDEILSGPDKSSPYAKVTSLNLGPMKYKDKEFKNFISLDNGEYIFNGDLQLYKANSLKTEIVGGIIKDTDGKYYLRSNPEYFNRINPDSRQFLQKFNNEKVRIESISKTNTGELILNLENPSNKIEEHFVCLSNKAEIIYEKTIPGVLLPCEFELKGQRISTFQIKLVLKDLKSLAFFENSDKTGEIYAVSSLTASYKSIESKETGFLLQEEIKKELLSRVSQQPIKGSYRKIINNKLDTSLSYISFCAALKNKDIIIDLNKPTDKETCN